MSAYNSRLNGCPHTQIVGDVKTAQMGKHIGINRIETVRQGDRYIYKIPSVAKIVSIILQCLATHVSRQVGRRRPKLIASILTVLQVIVRGPVVVIFLGKINAVVGQSSQQAVNNGHFPGLFIDDLPPSRNHQRLVEHGFGIGVGKMPARTFCRIGP